MAMILRWSYVVRVSNKIWDVVTVVYIFMPTTDCSLLAVIFSESLLIVQSIYKQYGLQGLIKVVASKLSKRFFITML